VSNHLLAKIVRIHHWLAGKLLFKGIPDRLQEKVLSQQVASERIIGWAQLIIVITFAILYALSPKTFAEGMGFVPVPWFLSAYFVFTILRLYITYYHRLSFFFLLLSIIVDMALLFGLIWSFHIQYDQPAAFYLKAPTLMYVFIFIALRALRFEPGFVIFAGLSAAIGWLLMTYYAVATTGMDHVTRDYVEYLTSNTILIGAEWDKIISILIVTAILATVISRGQDLLKSAIQNDAVASDLSKFVPDVIAKQIKEGSEIPDLERTEIDNCTMFFVDLESFTSLSEEMTPKELVTTLNAYFAVAAGSIHKHGGVINQFQGDSILASFNIPQKNEDHAKNAILAGLEILEMVKTRKFSEQTLAVRIGINTGTVTGGLVGIPERVHYTVIGDNVNIASRLEQLNKEYKTRILVSESTMLEAKTDFDYLELGKINLRGRQKLTYVYTIADPITGTAIS
jgi:adenylate cyclase